MPTLNRRIDALETTAAAAEYCTCQLSIKVIDYRAGIADDGGTDPESETLLLCAARQREIMRIVITADTCRRRARDAVRGDSRRSVGQSNGGVG